MPEAQRYFLKFAAAFVRGKALLGEVPPLPGSLASRQLDELSDDEFAIIFEHGLAHGLRLHKFKRTMGLARVQRVLGALRGIAPGEVLDIGSGRGAFLWPLLDAFPDLPVTACDRQSRRAQDVAAARLGGVSRLTSCHADATALGFEERQFDVVTMLEVLEHIGDCRKALAEVIRVARRAVVLSVPSRADDNPEHIHLFSVARLREMLAGAGVRQVSFEHVPGHIVAVASIAH